MQPYFELSGTKGFSTRIYYSESNNIQTNTSILQIDNIQFKNTDTVSWSSVDIEISITDQNGNKKVLVNDRGSSGRYMMPWMSANTWSDMENGGISFPWESNTIYHNHDGTGSATIKVYFSLNHHAGAVIDGEQTITLNTIPRESSLSLSTTSVNVGGTITANITRHSDAFTHTVEFYVNNNRKAIYYDVATSQYYPIDDSWYNDMPSSVSCTAYCRITTYNGSTQIGNAVQKSFTVNVPSNIIPSVGTITLDPWDLNGNNILVQGKNKINVSVSGCSAGIGSSIKSYTFSGPGISTTTTSTEVSCGPISGSGIQIYTVTVTDNRGRTNSKSASVTCYAYATPTIASFNAYRANSNGSANINGTYLRCTYATNYSSVNSTNSAAVTVYYNGKSTSASNGSVVIDLNGDTSTTYQVYLKITDSYGGSSASSTILVFGQTRILNITQNGTGFAIGKMAEQNELFECRWNAKFDGTASGPSGFSTSSDERVKKNIQDIDIDIVDSLRPIQYELIQDTNGKIHYGFVAQEVESILSDAGINTESIGIIGQINNNNRQEYVLTYTEFIPLLTKKCQLLQQELNELKQEIQNLKNNKGST